MAGEYSISYKKLVKRDFADDQDTVTEAQNKKERHDDSFVSDLLTRVNITRESMIAEEDFVLANNIPVIGAILCEFTNDLAERMVNFFYEYFGPNTSFSFVSKKKNSSQIYIFFFLPGLFISCIYFLFSDNGKT